MTPSIYLHPSTDGKYSHSVDVFISDLRPLLLHRRHQRFLAQHEVVQAWAFSLQTRLCRPRRKRSRTDRPGISRIGAAFPPSVGSIRPVTTSRSQSRSSLNMPFLSNRLVFDQLPHVASRQHQVKHCVVEHLPQVAAHCVDVFLAHYLSRLTKALWGLDCSRCSNRRNPWRSRGSRSHGKSVGRP